MKLSMLIRVAAIAAVTSVAMPAMAQTKLAVGYTVTGVNALLFIATKKGYFKSRGIDAEVTGMRGANVIVPSLVAGSIQVAAFTSASLVQAADGGIDLVAIGGLSAAGNDVPDSGLVARTGVDIRDAKDLEGKKVAVGSLGSLSHVMTVKWLMLKGADPAKVTFIETPLGQITNVMRGSAVHAASLPEPMLSAIIKAGDGKLVSYVVDSFPDNTVTTLSGVTRDWANRNPKLVAAYRDAIAEAEQFAKDKANQPEAQAMIAEMTGMKPEIVASIPFPKLRAGLTAEQLKWWVDTMTEQQLLRSNIDAGGLLYKP